MYAPSDDSFLLADAAKSYSGKAALEIGTGSGIVLEVLVRNFETVTASDIDLYALRYCKKRLSDSVFFVCCDAASALYGKYDLIVSNPPYLPDEEIVKDKTIFGGKHGIEITIHFIESAKILLSSKGKMLFVISSLADTSAFEDFLYKMDLEKKEINKKDLFFETLHVLEISPRQK